MGQRHWAQQQLRQTPSRSSLSNTKILIKPRLRAVNDLPSAIGLARYFEMGD